MSEEVIPVTFRVDRVETVMLAGQWHEKFAPDDAVEIPVELVREWLDVSTRFVDVQKRLRDAMNPEDDPDLFQCVHCEQFRSMDERHVGNGHTHPGDYCDACATGPGLGWAVRK